MYVEKNNQNQNKNNININENNKLNVYENINKQKNQNEFNENNFLNFYWIEFTEKDHPWMFSIVIYTGWCNLRCYDCHNRWLAGWDYDWQSNNIKKVDYANIYDNLDKEEIKLAVQSGLVNMVVICWGEVCLNNTNTIISTVNKIKEWNSDLKVRLDTNWTFPEKVDELKDYVDWFAIDIKWPYWNENYHNDIKKILGVKNSYLFNRIIQSLKIAKDLPYTIYRTPKYPIIDDENYFNEIKNYVKNELKNKPYYLNEFMQN